MKKIYSSSHSDYMTEVQNVKLGWLWSLKVRG